MIRALSRMRLLKELLDQFPVIPACFKPESIEFKNWIPAKYMPE